MAFFVDDNRSYFSLSLDPAGQHKAYVFRLTATQAQIARTLLPVCLSVAAAAACLTFLVGVGDYAGLGHQMLGREGQTVLICALALVAGLTALAEFAWFLWVQKRWKSALDEEERRSLRNLRLVRQPSLAAYWTFLLAMLVPVLGLVILEKVDPRSAGEALSNPVIIFPLAIGTAFLAFAVIRRIMIIGGVR